MFAYRREEDYDLAVRDASFTNGLRLSSTTPPSQHSGGGPLRLDKESDHLEARFLCRQGSACCRGDRAALMLLAASALVFLVSSEKNGCFFFFFFLTAVLFFVTNLCDLKPAGW